MKKLLTLTILIAAVSTQAAQINWGATGQIKFGDALVGNAGTTLQLVYLGSTTEAWSDYALQVAKGTTDNVVATKTTNAGSMSIPTASPYIFTFGDADDVNNKVFVDGVKFAMIATTKQDGKDYYWASDVYEVSESSSNYNGTSKTFTMGVAAASTINTGWKAVPEPSTAALALAGLALLLKRRKA